jgi:hypothetical protein
VMKISILQLILTAFSAKKLGFCDSFSNIIFYIHTAKFPILLI